jgi:hypothetical protein
MTICLLCYTLCELAAFGVGGWLCYMGYRLFRDNILSPATDLEGRVGKGTFSVRGAAPGTMFLLAGMGIVCWTLYNTADFSEEIEYINTIEHPMDFRSSTKNTSDSSRENSDAGEYNPHSTGIYPTIRETETIRVEAHSQSYANSGSGVGRDPQAENEYLQYARVLNTRFPPLIVGSVFLICGTVWRRRETERYRASRNVQ